MEYRSGLSDWSGCVRRIAREREDDLDAPDVRGEAVIPKPLWE